MSAGRAERIETAVDAVAAAVLAAAVGYCGLRLSSSLPIAAVALVLALCCGIAVLRVVRREERHFAIADFTPAEAPVEPLLLSYREPAREPAGMALADSKAAELLLDDVLAELGPDSRVVRLFDPAAMPTPAELRARIERHLGSAPVPAAPAHAPAPDASHALHEALAELRRSLR